MVDRGLRRAFDPAVEHEARDVASIDLADAAGAGPGRRDLRDAADVHDRPGDRARLRRRDLAPRRSRTAARRVWVHIADVSAYVAPAVAGRPRGLPARARACTSPAPSSRCCPTALSNNACSLVPGQDRLAVTVELVFDGDDVKRASFYRSLIRSDERLEYGFVDRVFEGSERAAEPWGAPLAVARRVAAALAASSSAPGRAGARLGRAGVRVRSRRQRGLGRAGRADRVAPADRAPDDRRQRAGGDAARVRAACRRCTACTSGPTGPRRERLIDQLASLGVPDAAGARGHTHPAAGGRVIGEASQLRRALGGIAGRARPARTRRAWCCARCKQAYYDHAQPAGTPGCSSPRYCHFTSPIRRYPDLICHRALLSAVGGRRAGARRLVGGGGRAVDLGARARGDDDRARCRRHRAAASCSSGGWPRSAIRRGVRGRGRRADRRRRVRGVRRAGLRSRDCCRCGGCAATGGSSTSRARCWSARATAARSAWAIRCRCESGGSTRRGVGWTCSRRGRRTDGALMAKGRKRKAGVRATWRPTARRRSATT